MSLWAVHHAKLIIVRAVAWLGLWLGWSLVTFTLCCTADELDVATLLVVPQVSY